MTRTRTLLSLALAMLLSASAASAEEYKLRHRSDKPKAEPKKQTAGHSAAATTHKQETAARASAPAAHAPAAHAPAAHAPAAHAPAAHAPAAHAPATHAPATHAPATHATPTHAEAPTARAGAPAHAPAAGSHAAQPGVAPAAVWADLLAGNARFVLGSPHKREFVNRRRELAVGQHPRTIVLTCSDSRVPPELVFDQSLGDLFVVRTAGEVVDAVATGSIEYAVEHLGANLIVVLGHEKCGAVSAALSDEPMPTPSLIELVGHIRPGIERVRHAYSGAERLLRSIEANVEHSAQELVAMSPVLHERVEQGSLLVVKAVYALGGGEVRELGRGVDLAALPTTHTALPANAHANPAAPADHAPAPRMDTAPPRSDASAAPAPPHSPIAAVTAASPVPAAVTSSIAWEGQLRYRYEARSVLDYRLPGAFKRPATQLLGDAGDVSIMRTRLGATLRIAPRVRGYLNLQDARVMGAEGSPNGTLANVDLYQAYVDLDSLGGSPFAFRAGRQSLSYGDSRLVGTPDWGNAGRAYDGARVRFAPKSWQVDGFMTWINEGRVSGQDRMFTGLDATWRTPGGLELEGYHFARMFGDTGFVAESGSKGGLYDGTSGARVRAAHGRIEARAEGAVQRGRRARDDVRSWFGAGRMAFTMPGAWKPRVMVEHAIASGDKDPADGISQRFEPLYWSGHGFQGALDVVGASNVKDWCAGLTLQPRKRWTLQSEFHDFTLLEARDAWADDAGTTLRRDATGAAGTDLGGELDVTVKWDGPSRVTLFGGWSRFWAGSYVERSGGGRPLDWGFAQLAVSF